MRRSPQNGAVLLKPADSEGVLARLLRHFKFSEKLDLLIKQSGDESSATKLLVTCLIAGAIGYVVGLKFTFLGSRPLTAAGLGVVATTLPFLNVLRKRKKQFGLFESQLPEALDFIPGLCGLVMALPSPWKC